MRLHGEEAARMMVGDLQGSAGVATGVSINSRTLKAGQLFFAIRGPRHDGHRFVIEAFGKGAAGAVVENNFRFPAEELGDRFLIRVSDPTEALGCARPGRAAKEQSDDCRNHWKPGKDDDQGSGSSRNRSGTLLFFDLLGT